MERQTLHDGWQLSVAAGPAPDGVRAARVPAAVPGSTHLDLLAAGLIPDPFLDRNEESLTWMHRTDWRYELTFETRAPAGNERIDLVFEGLDTVAAVELNGLPVGTAVNMHRTHRFDVRHLLRDGANELTVTFSAALTHAEQLERELGRRDHAYPHPFNMIRKMACSFGWDWGPDLQTAGIWRPVRLERWHTGRLASVRPLVTVDPDGTGRVEVHADLERGESGTGPLWLVVTVDGRTARVPFSGDQAVATALVPGARLWWPAGYGEQPRYELAVSLEADGETIDATEHRIGFRTITVDTEPDEIGTPFTFVVNGRPIFAKGANWIPDDHFLTRVTRDRLACRVDQAVEANFTMLRVWGGGIYETEDFYDVCDERGILVWQDFPFACAAYPEEEPLWSEVAAEARENVARLTGHPSLALWNGNNENLWGFADWGWPETLGGKTWGLRYYTELLPAIVAELDPTRHYAPGSPYSPGDRHPNDADHGTRHDWQVWNHIDYTRYRDHVPRFCSEFGFQGPPTWATLSSWVHDEPLTPTSPGFLLHQKADDGNGKLERGLAAHLPVPADFADWHWATQLNQARAVAFGIEHFRSWWPRTAGALVWQLNDCWPATSWAAVDSEGRRKPLWYALRHAFAPRLLTVQPREDRSVLFVVNDHDQQWSGDLRVQRQSFAGAVLEETVLPFSVNARSVAGVELPAALLSPSAPAGEVLVATTDQARVVHTFGEDLDLAYDPAPLTAQVAAVEGGYRVDVRATSFARDVAVLADRVAPDAVVEEMLVPMLAGESRSFLVRTGTRLADPAVLAGPLVLRSANGLCAPRARS
ncbi:glycoside hydrolase family 2 protein [Crossiella sp. SN42]|uniref:glycoside hydrolase family 2 protein n=1 Tax=Crossiella sp. SN42 TaxID=2944808 RepID=UPI00207C96B1|nr:glycoside hydrolase family 2 protein [Crossiella sp. SN42]MCO1574539.1 glycoside hydrolase family 2 protein [Crossiella sp. SN42]